MNLPLRYFHALIEAVEPETAILDEHAQPLKIQWIAATSTSSIGRKGFLYFVDKKIALEQSPGQAFGCVVHKEASDEYAGIPRIVVPNACDIGALLDYAITEVDRYRSWEDSMRESLIGNISLQNMLDITYEIIPRPMYIADSCWRMIARIDADMDEMSGIWHHQLQHGGYLPIETINALNETGEYERITNSTRAFSVETKAFVIGFIAKTIRFAGKLLGYLFIVDLWHDLTPCDVEIADRFGNMLGSALGSREGSILQVGSFHKSMLDALLDQDHIEEKMVSNLLATTVGWKATGDFKIVVLRNIASEWDNPMVRMKAVGIITSGYDCYSEPYENMMVIIFSNAELDACDFNRHLRACAAKLKRPIFVSGRFSNFLDFPEQFRRTCDIANRPEYATPTDEGAVIDFDQNFQLHLARACANNLPKIFEVEQLHEHDSKHGTEYVKTLYTFLVNERNYVSASKALFLHKNTLRNRIEKINELIDIDLNDPLVRLRLIVTLNNDLMAQSLD